MTINDKVVGRFKPNQLVSSTDVVRDFPRLRMKAKEAPLLILDKNSPDSVLMSIEDYSGIIKFTEDLSEELFDLKVIKKIEEMEKTGIRTVPFSEMMNENIEHAMKDIQDWDIPDEELFE